MTRRFQRSSTRFSKDGRTVFATLRIDRGFYEFARAWAAYHAGADPAGTAEEQLEGYLAMAGMEAMDASDWQPPPEIEALYPAQEEQKAVPSDMDDDIPF